MYAIAFVLGQALSRGTRKLRDAFGLDFINDVYDDFFDFFTYPIQLLVKGLKYYFTEILPEFTEFIYSILFIELVDTINAMGNKYIEFCENNFGNVANLNFLYFYFGFIIVVFIIKLIIHVISAIL